jgi:cysteine desulfurase
MMDDAPQPLYLDYNATTPLDPRVFEVMKEWYLGPPSNAGSRTHVYGQRAKDAVEKARKQVADVIGAKPEEVFFTSGATESDNLAILGLTAYGERTDRKHIISTTIEHKAVLEPLAQLQRRGFEVEFAPVTSGGYVEPDAIRERLRPDTLLVSVMHANNETGVLQPLQEIAEFMAGSETYFHTDAAQTFGKEVEELRSLPCDFMSISGHKIYGPQGIGALCVSARKFDRRLMTAIIAGGGQERGLRSGTLPIPLVVALGKAADLAGAEYIDRRERAARVKQTLILELSAVEHRVNGDATRSQAHVVNVTFPGIDSEALMMQLQNVVAISNGSACTTSQYAPSHVLNAMGLSDDLVHSAVRISWGPGIKEVPASCLLDAVRRLRV